MDDGNSWSRIFVFIILVVIDFIFFSFGSAIQNANSVQLEKELEGGDKRAGRILRIINRPGKFVNAIQLASNLIGFITGSMLIWEFAYRIKALPDAAGGSYAGYIALRFLVFILSLVLMVSLGIIVPKRLAMRDPHLWANRMIGIIGFLMIFLSPLIFLVNLLSFLVLRIFGIDYHKQEEKVTEEDIMSMVNEGHEKGILESSEAQMITNIFELNDKDAADIMTHRKNLVCIDASLMLGEAVDFILNEGSNSRYPVYENDIDNIIGILHMKDALIFSNKGDYADTRVAEIPQLLREAYFIPETRSIDSLFKEMQSQKMHMVVVVDEYGQTAGIVTMEDILEEIVGNIMDEYDVDEEMITKCEDGSYIMRGMTPLDEVQEALEIEFDEEEYDNFDTLNGLIISKLDRIPTNDEEIFVSMHGYHFIGLEVDNKMILLIKVEKAEEEEKSEGEEED
ncbi:MAG: hemolysin family protein [Johnsonella sp.]|nr:hemolysin family protein [Johnsonella sp.]